MEERNEIKKITPDTYPPQLLEIPGVPEALWLRGSLPPSETKYLAVVGSRALSRYGREACELLIKGLAGYPISIVSGLALGADACAHQVALSAGLHTIAIPGSGLDDAVIGPRSNLALANKILASGGALLSEHPPDYIAHPYDFPARNRIMAGLANAVLIIEAGPKSGTLITARLASEYSRELVCVPHRIGDPHGFGHHFFSRMGATTVTSSEHILEALHIEPLVDSEAQNHAHKKLVEQLSPAERNIYEILEEPHQRDDLIRSIGIPTHEALATVISLEFKGLAQEVFGVWRRVP